MSFGEESQLLVSFSNVITIVIISTNYVIQISESHSHLISVIRAFSTVLTKVNTWTKIVFRGMIPIISAIFDVITKVIT